MKSFIFKLVKSIIVIGLLLKLSISYGGETLMSTAETKAFIEEVFNNVLEDTNATERAYEKYFSKDYIQRVDGKVLNYSDFVKHMQAQKAVLKSLKITFKYIIVEGDKIATVHIVDGVKKDGGIIEAQVNAVFQIKNKKIILCDELTRMIKGAKSDADLGSRH